MPYRWFKSIRRGYCCHRQSTEASRRCFEGELSNENLDALEKGLPNLLKHIENINVKYGLPAVVAINRFPTDTDAELSLIEEKCREYGANVALSDVWAKGGEGGVTLAREVIRLIGEDRQDFRYISVMICR